MKWTKEQENSIYAKPSELIISAAAGSGKTQVLTTRIIERLKDPVSPVSVDKLLVVTFTKAAAAEMKERIAKALRKEANNATDFSVRSYMKKQLALLGSSHISTIDSFCYNIVKQNFFKVNLPSDISMGEGGEISLLKLAALEDTANAFYCAVEKMRGNELSEENEEYAAIIEKHFPVKEEREFILNGFIALSNAFCYDKRDSEFSERIVGDGDYTTMISMLYEKSQSAAYPEKWLNQVANMYDSKLASYSETPFCIYTVESCKRTLKDTANSILQLAEFADANGVTCGDFLRDEAKLFRSFSECRSYGELYDFFNANEFFPRIKGIQRNCDPLIRSYIVDTRSAIKEHIKKNYLPSVLKFSAEECEELREQLFPQIKALCSAAIILGRLFYEKMTSRKILSFSACSHLALKIISEDGKNLTETGVALQNKFDEIYIDEYQDSNDLQDILFGLISKGRCFVVGDIKQSIYGFRNADPTIFMKKCDNSAFDEDALKRKIFLSKNFRSVESVISGVNCIFDIIMTKESCGLDYKADHRLGFGADFIPADNPKEKCELIIVEEDGNVEMQRYSEAVCIAEKIKDIIKSKRLVWDKDSGERRPVRYSDIAILSRALNPITAIYEAAFASSGVPCYIDGDNDLYETTEVGQVLEILKLIDNAQSDIPLACALRSPMFMFDENELLQIRLAGNESFCDAFYGICSYKYQVAPKLAEKCKFFNDKLKQWRLAAGFLSVGELIQKIYTDTNLYSSVLSFPDGQMRRANLDLLLEKAEEFERSTYNGLFNFVNYVQKIKKSSDTTSEAKAISEKMDVVRLMSIHKSKGLEFPIVFVTECSKEYRKPKSKAGGLIMSNNAGIGINIVNPLLRCKYTSPMRSALVDMEIKENACEEMRLLYVALTRAREKLYAVGTVRSAEEFYKSREEAVDRLTATDILKADNYLSLFALAICRGASAYWDVNIVSAVPEEENSTEENSVTTEFAENKEISRLLDFKYPHNSAINLPNKASVSLLKSADFNMAPSDDGNIPLLNRASSKKTELRKPDFRRDKTRGTFFGTAHHKLFQYIDYNFTSVEEECERLLKASLITEDEYNVIDTEKIEEFFRSPLGEMLKNSEVVHREDAFVISIDAGEISPTLPDGEFLCVQGVIDCYFEYDGKIILIDYKTDKYDNPETIVEKYKKQLYYYEKALKIKYKDKIIQKYLYLMHKNDIIEV